MKGRASDQRREQPLVRAALFVASAYLIGTSGPVPTEIVPPHIPNSQKNISRGRVNTAQMNTAESRDVSVKKRVGGSERASADEPEQFTSQLRGGRT